MVKTYRVEDYLHTLSEWMQTPFLQVREIILGSNPEIEESMKYGVPFYTFHGYLFYLGTYKKTQLVLAFCYGAFIEDEYNCLRADAKQSQLRHWPIKPDQELDFDLMATYIIRALAYNEKGKKHHF